MKKDSIEVQILNYKEIEKALGEDLKKAAKTVVNSTLSDVKNRVPGWISAEVRKEYNIKKRDVNDAISNKNKIISVRTTGEKIGTAVIRYEGRRLTLLHFNMTPKVMPALTDKRVTVKIGNTYRMMRVRAPIVLRATIKKGHRKVIKGRYDTSPFVAENPRNAGQYVPFQRQGKSRAKFQSIRTISVPQMITNEKVYDAIEEKLNVEVGKRLEHNINRVFEKEYKIHSN